MPEAVIAIVGGIESLVSLYLKLRADASQSAALTPEQWAALDARVNAAMSSGAWKTDDQLGK